MVLEALCEWRLCDDDHCWLAAVEDVWQRRGWDGEQRIAWKSQPFASHDDALARAISDCQGVALFIEETSSMVTKVSRSEAGLVTHHHPALPPGREPLIVDFMHEYAARLASAAALGGDPRWYDEAAQQYLGYAAVLCDAK